jgi:hypothetical protein
MNKGKRFLFFFPMMILGVSLLGLLVMLLWNWLMPVIFALPTITFTQALGLFVLSKILFSSFNFGKRHRPTPFNNPAFKEKMMNMSDEERQAFKEQWKQRCGK